MRFRISLVNSRTVVHIWQFTLVRSTKLILIWPYSLALLPKAIVPRHPYSSSYLMFRVDALSILIEGSAVWS